MSLTVLYRNTTSKNKDDDNNDNETELHNNNETSEILGDGDDADDASIRSGAAGEVSTSDVSNLLMHPMSDEEQGHKEEGEEVLLEDSLPPFIFTQSSQPTDDGIDIHNNNIIYSKSSPGRSIYKSKASKPNYAPISQWIGRLIFNVEKRNPKCDDGVTIEIEHAPIQYQYLIGKILPLRWDSMEQNHHHYHQRQNYNEEIRNFVNITTSDVKLNDKGREILECNEYLKPPSRLHYRFGIGPLESLAGSRVENNLHVMLPVEGVTVKDPTPTPTPIPTSYPISSSFEFNEKEKKSSSSSSSSTTTTTIYLGDHPVQVTGVYYCVVIIIEKLEHDLFKVKHYNPMSNNFDGPTDIIRFPQAKELRFSNQDTAIPSTNFNIQKSPENKFGWYFYGSFVKDDNSNNGEDRFVVEALEPFRALRLDPMEYIDGGRAGCCCLEASSSSTKATRFIQNGNFSNMKGRSGSLTTTLVDLNAQMRNHALELWKEGDQMLVIQCAGGMKSDTFNLDLRAGNMAVEGRLAYGYATIIRDILTGELRFDIDYIQVFETSTIGVISGAVKRQCFLGSLDKGCIGVRPISDVMIKIQAITKDYKIGSRYNCCPLHHLKVQLHLMAARYRIGDGLGVVNISGKTSCTQDANMAFYVAMKQAEDSIHRAYKDFRYKCESNWDFDTVVMLERDLEHFKKLKSLCADLRSILEPYGVGRCDWRQNAASVVLAENLSSTERKPTMCQSLTTHHAVFPRIAFDNILQMLLKNDAKLWFVTTVVVGGENKHIVPLRPMKRPEPFKRWN